MNRSFHSYEEENMHYWSNRASGYSDVNKEELTSNQKNVWSTLLDERIQKHFQNRDRADIHILDIGTGPGFFAIILRELGYHVTGIDYTKSMLLEAKKNAKHLSNEIHFLQMNAEELTFPSKSFDLESSPSTKGLHSLGSCTKRWWSSPELRCQLVSLSPRRRGKVSSSH